VTQQTPKPAPATVGRCYWHRDDQGWALIPMCLGCAVNGPYGCTCDVPESRVERAERQRGEAMQQVGRLLEIGERRLEKQASAWRKIKRLQQRITELEQETAS